MTDFVHEPVLLNEVLSFVKDESGFFVDGTLGSGGHSQAVLKNTSLSIVGIDRDPDAIDRAKERLQSFSTRVEYWVGSYADIPVIMKERMNQVSFVLLDLGYSSDQIESSTKGLSFMKDGPLDMRYNQTDLSIPTAADIVNKKSKNELIKILREYGDERFASRIVHTICEVRKDHRIVTTGELRDLIESVVPVSQKRSKINPATKTFQALRIAVNKELEELKIFLHEVVPQLPKGCRIAVISFHSLEDRLVKQAFKKHSLSTAKVLTKKIIKASNEELSRNARSRSAKMRVIEII